MLLKLKDAGFKGDDVNSLNWGKAKDPKNVIEAAKEAPKEQTAPSSGEAVCCLIAGV